ncbi:hypothetical protein LIER_15837 [Lithospermum erythrorhizon]|uniref:Uncharacterized protein n=1 Tax=Lithospermum erythrorhizon TaxID=34254 RepID=A0AAV3Q5C2_LITER
MVNQTTKSLSLTNVNASSGSPEPNQKLMKLIMCSHCGAMKFEFEPPTFCCDNGRIKLAETIVPAELEDLLTSQSDEAKDFQKNIRVFNSMFSFTCFVVNIDKHLASSRKRVYTFRVQGQIYHDLPGLIP